MDFDEEDQKLWESLNPLAMSDEEYDEEKKINVFCTLPWRSEISTSLVRRCDAALGIVRVYRETPSNRLPNDRCKNFVNQDYSFVPSCMGESNK